MAYSIKPAGHTYCMFKYLMLTNVKENCVDLKSLPDVFDTYIIFIMLHETMEC